MIDALLKTPFATLIDTQTRLLVFDTQFHPLPGFVICRSSNDFFFLEDGYYIISVKERKVKNHEV